VNQDQAAFLDCESSSARLSMRIWILIFGFKRNSHVPKGNIQWIVRCHLHEHSQLAPKRPEIVAARGAFSSAVSLPKPWSCSVLVSARFARMSPSAPVVIVRRQRHEYISA